MHVTPNGRDWVTEFASATLPALGLNVIAAYDPNFERDRWFVLVLSRRGGHDSAGRLIERIVRYPDHAAMRTGFGAIVGELLAAE